MPRLKIATLVTVILAFFVTVGASPAVAVPFPSILHDQPFAAGVDATRNWGGPSPLITTSAISANGERVVTVNSPQGGACTPQSGKVQLLAGVASSTSTAWQSPLEIPTGRLHDCGMVRDLKVSLSADGTRGLVTWLAIPFDLQDLLTQDPEIRFTTFEWPLDQASPSQVTLPQTFSAGDWAYYLDHALAADGSRAVLSFFAETNGMGIWAQYAVIDMEHPEFARQQLVPIPQFQSVPYTKFPVTISADGEVIALGTFRPTGQYGDEAFRDMKVFTCMANCYPNRLKVFSAMLPTNQGGSTIDMRMNADGTRLVVAWSRTAATIPGVSVPPRALRALVLTPFASRASQVVTGQVQYFNTVDYARGTIDLSADGTRFVVGSDHPAMWVNGASGSARVLAGTITSGGKFVLGKYSSVSTSNGALRSVSLTGSPERVVVAQNRVGSEVSTFISDSAAMKYWSEISVDDVSQSALQVALSPSAARIITSFDATVDVGFVRSSVTVRNVLGVLGYVTAPSISGVPAVGKVLTAKNGTWNATGTFSYQWARAGVALDGETGPTLELEQADAGSKISVRVTHSKPGFYSRTVNTAETAIVTGGVMTAGTPLISDTTPVVGQTLSSFVSWTPTTSGGFSYSWKVAGKQVATTATYVPRTADIGKTITLTITKVLPGYTTTSRTSAATSAVAAVG